MTLAAVLCCAMAIEAQGLPKPSKMSPWLRGQYRQQQEAVKQSGGRLRTQGRPVMKYMLTLVESTDQAQSLREKGGVVVQDFGEGICAAFLPMDSLGVMEQSSTILRLEANKPATLHNDTSAKHNSEDFSVLKYCWNLMALDVGHNNVTNLDFLYDLPNLRILIVACNTIEDITPIASLKHLEYLELFKNRILDISPLEGLDHLMDLIRKRKHLICF